MSESIVTATPEVHIVTAGEKQIVVSENMSVNIMAVGTQGPTGIGIPTGGTTGQVLAKTSADNYAAEWVDAGSGGSVTGATDSTLTLTGTTLGINLANANIFTATQTVSDDGIGGTAAIVSNGVATFVPVRFTGFAVDASTDTGGVEMALNHNSTGNRQLVVRDTAGAAGASTGFRYLVGTYIAQIDAIDNDGTTQRAINIGGGNGVAINRQSAAYDVTLPALLTVYGDNSKNILELWDIAGGAAKFTVDNAGNLTALGSLASVAFVKSGGTSSEFLKADGSVDSTVYGTVTGATNSTLTLTGTTLGINLGNANTWTAKQTIELATSQLQLKFGTGKTCDFTVDTNGDMTLDLATSGAKFIFADKIIVPNGTSALPSIAFASSPTTGFYQVSAGVMGVCVGGVNVGQFDAISNQLRIYAGALRLQSGGGSVIAEQSHMISGNNNGYDLGATGNTWRNGFFGTSIRCPLLFGGTGTTQSLILKSTSGVGAAGADIIFQVGNNGATEGMRILNSGVIRRTATYTVATLPAGTNNDTTFVSDALAPVWGAAVVGGGAVRVPVYYDGAWKVG
ncbi:MAG: hypothetical protein EBR02_04875 [Alphaproteobacteria bacterium]|nr:hypothetical protein [Alphaproteobacteria bacterium]